TAQRIQAEVEASLTNSLDPVEQYYFDRAHLEIISNRSESQLGTWFAIFGLGAALCSAFPRDWANRDTTWLPLTVANVTLTFHFIALVQISGNIGAFTSVFGPLDALDVTVGARGQRHGIGKTRPPKDRSFADSRLRQDLFEAPRTVKGTHLYFGPQFA
ncbi:hypothetical protein AOQ84DRAFT_380838, partial [Glonium stellatum]